MHFAKTIKRLDTMLLGALRLHCNPAVPRRAFTRQSKGLPVSKLTWDSFKPTKTAEQIDEAVDAATATDAAADSAATAAATEALASASRRYLTLTAEDAKFLQSGVSPLAVGLEQKALAVAKNLPAGCPHWGRISNPAALPEQLAASSAQRRTPLNPIYDACAKTDWARVFLRPPVNPWQELIQLTAEGKLWHYPIDNEQGKELEPDAQLSFQSHIMLERQLQDWVPKTGPVRHFMETVCVGLSKNPHLTAAEKAEHLDWFKRYFADKLDQIQAAYEASARTASPESEKA